MVITVVLRRVVSHTAETSQKTEYPFLSDVFVSTQVPLLTAASTDTEREGAKSQKTEGLGGLSPGLPRSDRTTLVDLLRERPSPDEWMERSRAQLDTVMELSLGLDALIKDIGKTVAAGAPNVR